jgi:hypothetical protein
MVSLISLCVMVIASGCILIALAEINDSLNKVVTRLNTFSDQEMGLPEKVHGRVGTVTPKSQIVH